MNVTSRRLACQIPSSTKACEGSLGNRCGKNRPALAWSDDLLLDRVPFENLELFREYSLPPMISGLCIFHLNKPMAEWRIRAGLAQYAGWQRILPL